MTTINEHGLTIELPGHWTADPNPEPGAIVYRQFGGEGVLTAMLLSVHPVYALADKRRLLSEYVDHRALVEQERRPTLLQYEEEITEFDDGRLEAIWTAEDSESPFHQRHRVLLHDDVLLDVCIAGIAEDARLFDMAAVIVLASVTFKPPSGAEADDQ